MTPGIEANLHLQELQRIPFLGTNEGANIQFQAEFSNAWNHAQFNGYFTSFGQTGFGAANSTRDPRIIQFGLKFQF